jgi:hypothetical protein
VEAVSVRWFDVALLIVFWAAAAWHLPKVRGESWQRCMWAGTVAFALILTARIPAVTAWIDDVSGHIGVSVLLKHVLGIFASSAYLEWAICMRIPEGRVKAFERRDLVGWLVVGLLVLTFALIPAGRNADAYAPDGHHWQAALHKSVFLLYLGYASVYAGIVFARAARRASAPALVWGLRLLAAGHLLIPAYLVPKVLAMSEYLGWLHTHVEGSNWVHAAYAPAVVALPMLLVGAGIPGAVSTVSTIRTHRQLRALRPLHALVAPAAPGVTLTLPPGGPELRGSTEAYLRLFRTVVEIRDGLWALRRFTDSDLWWRIRRDLRARGLDGEDLDAAAVACWATVGAAAFARGDARQPLARLPVYADTELQDEVRFLVRAQEARTWPETRACLDAVDRLLVAA